MAMSTPAFARSRQNSGPTSPAPGRRAEVLAPGDITQGPSTAELESAAAANEGGATASRQLRYSAQVDADQAARAAAAKVGGGMSTPDFAAETMSTTSTRRGSIISRGMTFDSVCEALEEIYHEVINVREGKNADYIPELAAVNPDLFSIAVCSAEGQVWSIGDDDIPFTMQSTVKPLLYSKALQLVGSDMVHRHIGYEPSGQRFNAFVMDTEHKPHNPLINAGAIMSSAIVASTTPSKVERFKAVKNFVEQCVGHVGRVSYDNSVFLSELGTAERNFALTYFMREQDPFLRSLPVTDVLEMYFSACSLAVDCRGMAAIAGTYAMAGICPTTHERVLSRDNAREAMQLMFSCGMYDYSGRWSFEVGIPSKSGVSGAIWMCVPGRFGIAIWSPPLDEMGNSVRGLHVARELVKRFPDMHMFNAAMHRAENSMVKKIKLVSEERENLEYLLISAASKGDVHKVRRLIDELNMDIDSSDYDGRTALHLALAEGHEEIVKFLLERGANVHIKDRFGNTPFSEAEKRGVAHLLPPEAALSRGESVQGELNELGVDGASTSRRNRARSDGNLNPPTINVQGQVI